MKYITFSLILIILGCSDNKVKKKLNYRNPRQKTFEVIGESKRLEYKLPDTLQLKDTLNGYLIFKSSFDTLNLREEDDHFVDFYFAKTNSISNKFEEFSQKKIDTFARIRDSIIPIFNITFDKKGSQLFEGYIVDYLFQEHSEDSIRFRTNKQQIMYRVFIK
ncbi:hypothetical protein KO500_13545 [Cellulophaga baltica]|uniref:hypothetical protein n=1 Tax=Cellulophaga TaxID=104264 RepID=UPI001C06ECBB|nr:MULTISPECIES: hypothetical protein [Cellulophaga]MBU2997467.1 hypothetical protein [Cellulophaga baltica]MDO6768864.1 hypothetical protein [Cellulophaga sp. 1_MG-2023]